MSGKDHEGLKIINTAIIIADGQYQIGLLSKHEDPHLLFDRSLAETCLKALKGRFYPLSTHCLNLLVFSVHFFFPSKLFFSSYGELMLHGEIRYKNLSPCLMLPIWMELHKLNLKCHSWCRAAFLLCPEEERPSLSSSSVSEHYSDVQLKKSVMSITQRSSIKQLLKHFSSWPGLLTIVMAIWSDNGTDFTSADREIPLAIGQWKR